MRPLPIQTLRVVALAAVLSGACSAQGKANFERDVLPIFKASCAPCHIGSSAMGKLHLDSEADVLRGGRSGPVVSPGNSNDSLLVKRILGLAGVPRMPLEGRPLTPEQVTLIRSWIDGQHDQPNMDRAVDSEMFAKDVRPILAAGCYSCHGPDVQQNGLRLDSLASVLKGSDFGPVVIPHESEDSRLVRRLLAKERPQMPYGGPPLPDAEIATIRKWIDSGAPGPDATTPIATVIAPKHWAYVKPVRPAVPTVHESAWVKNPIDNFVLAGLEKEGIKPARDADRATLIRRASLDVTGLPPSPQEVNAFIADRSPDAYEKVVDRLFASPHYGEHWARQWLDLARYADSNGYEKDRKRVAWAYRDWVIRALNSDMSFRDFTVAQIAGDMLPQPTQDQLIATGFNRNSMLNQEGGIDVNEYYYYSQVDRVNTTAEVWLGSTLGCAQCHNHKFDPFTQKDYYRFLAFFNNSDHEMQGKGDRWMQEPNLELPTAQQEQKSKVVREQIKQAQEKLDTQTPELDKSQRAWETTMLQAESAWTPLMPTVAKSEKGATLNVQKDESVLATGNNPQADTYVIEAQTKLQGATGIRLEVLPDASLPHGGPGRDEAGNFFLSDFTVEVASTDHPGTYKQLALKKAFADESQDGYGVDQVVHKKDGQLSGWAIEESTAEPIRRQAVFITEGNFGSGVTRLRITMSHQMRHASRNIGRFRLALTTAAQPQTIIEVPARFRPILSIPETDRTSEQKSAIASAYRAVAPELDATRKQLDALNKELDELGIVTAQVMREEPAFVRPAADLRERGTFTSPGELVYADVPSALGTLPQGTMPNRLGLAEWLVSNDNPLTARVTVNHFWEALFGRGIVETAEDFGTQGDTPSQPELLDWLAIEFMQNGWDMKKIQRLIVTSATYRQESKSTPELLAKDPYNRLYARGPRFRADAETIHDSALAAAGLLSDKLYGPPVFPYQPDGVWNIPYSSDKWTESTGEYRYRRAIYTFIRRSAPYPSLVTYDAPSRESCTVRRVRTNTPLQALTSLNDPFFFEAARAMAKRVLAEGGASKRERLIYAFQLTMARRPSAAETDRILAFYDQELDAYSKQSDLAWKALQIAPGSIANGPEVAAWTMVSNALLNTDEAITKE